MYLSDNINQMSSITNANMLCDSPVFPCTTAQRNGDTAFCVHKALIAQRLSLLFMNTCSLQQQRPTEQLYCSRLLPH